MLVRWIPFQSNNSPGDGENGRIDIGKIAGAVEAVIAATAYRCSVSNGGPATAYAQVQGNRGIAAGRSQCVRAGATHERGT